MAITFTRKTQGSYDATTDTATISTSTITGVAVRTRGDPNRYQALSLIESEAPSIVFVPTTYGDLPEPGDTTTWASTAYTARDVEPIAPDGVAIAAIIILEK